eukprot:TRINITY_DN29679_c0_g1_i1.p1 TRINITY_DN29679_c0_g1~~TRINITY_DN29679_c0_g1_i1.p1  ORF type:complete len:606 (+),score=181.69 TRINITY_DN29679_c0_g1_i1:110-1819(+)
MPDRERLQVCVFGPRGSGKSTLVGQLGVRLAAMDGSIVSEVEAQAAAKNRNDRKLAWLSDTLAEERRGGGSVMCHHWSMRVCDATRFPTAMTVVDTPGNARFTKRLTEGLQGAHVGLFVVSGAVGEFETSMSEEGNARDALLYAFSLGLPQLVVCVTKMDHASVGFAKSRFEAVSAAVTRFASAIGFSNAVVIPVSGWAGTNVVSATYSDGAAARPGPHDGKMSWFRSPPLVDRLVEFAKDSDFQTAISSLSAAEAEYGSGATGPVRLVVDKVIPLRPQSGSPEACKDGTAPCSVAVVGQLVAGTLQNEDAEVALAGCGAVPNFFVSRHGKRCNIHAPAVQVHASVESLEVFRTQRDAVATGEMVGLKLLVAPQKELRPDEREAAEARAFHTDPLLQDAAHVMRPWKAKYVSRTTRNVQKRDKSKRSGAPDSLGWYLRRGSVLGMPGDPSLGYCEYFEAQILLVRTPGSARGISTGFAPVVDVHYAHVACEIVQIMHIYDRATGAVVQQHAESMQGGDAAVVRMRPFFPLVVEEYKKVPAMGRFVMRANSKLIGMGVVRHVKRWGVDDI